MGLLSMKGQWRFALVMFGAVFVIVHLPGTGIGMSGTQKWCVANLVFSALVSLQYAWHQCCKLVIVLMHCIHLM